jgi:hypothetical protein
MASRSLTGTTRAGTVCGDWLDLCPEYDALVLLPHVKSSGWSESLPHLNAPAGDD